MARFGVSIEKAVSYRLSTQIFANIYYYEGALTPESNVDLETMLDSLVAAEKTMHSAGVVYVRGRVWSTGTGQASNRMIVDKALSGTGAMTHDVNIDRERAFLVRFRAGSDSRGRPVYLRKYWHLLATTVGGSAITQAMGAQTAELNSTQRTALVNFANSIKQLTPAGTPMNLVAQTGRPISGATEAHRFYEHHQLGDMWRGV